MNDVTSEAKGASEGTTVCRDLYLDLLKKILTGTLFGRQPEATDSAAELISHYGNRATVTGLPVRRLNHIQSCVAEILSHDVPGDFIETGVWRGGATIFMRALLKAHRVHNRWVWVADSFEGLPEADEKLFPNEAAFLRREITRDFKRLAVPIEEVKDSFAAYGMLDDQVRFLKGWFKDTLPHAPIGKLSLMRLDGDFYESTRDALTNLYDKLSVGGMVIIDDYGEDDFDCRRAVDEFREQRAIKDPLMAVDSRCYWWRRTA